MPISMCSVSRRKTVARWNHDSMVFDNTSPKPCWDRSQKYSMPMLRMPPRVAGHKLGAWPKSCERSRSCGCFERDFNRRAKAQRIRDDVLARSHCLLNVTGVRVEFERKPGRTVTRMINRWIFYAVLVGITVTSAFGQQSSPPSGESHRYRTILTLVGGGGGFAGGLFAGLA